MSLDDICARLNVPRTTVYYWIKGIPITRTQKQHAGQRAGTLAMSAKYAARRKAGYDAAYQDAGELLKEDGIRDFVILYLAEGYRKNRNVVSLSNSNPSIIKFAHSCMRRMATNPHFAYSFQYHADQDPERLKRFWAACLNVGTELIRPIRKTNSGQLKGRRFACVYGVFQVRVGDTLFRSRLQALMDVVQEQWAVDRTS